MLLKQWLYSRHNINKLFNKQYPVISLCRCLQKYYSTTTDRQPKALRSLKPKSTRDTVQYYVDKCRVRVIGGNGGHGAISFLSIFGKEEAGPDGGDGGHGGHVVFKATKHVKNLNHCLPVIKAPHGEKGLNKNCHGKNAEHTFILVPVGTIIKDDTGLVVGDLSLEGMMFVAARGGSGGKGNRFFTTDVEQAPEVAEFGAEGESLQYELELRSMAHIGLIGFPNAGKSTLLRAVSRARPRVAPYPFTTLHPHVGMVLYDDYEQVAIADLPGLIADSHKNRGLGIQFLQHAERCSGLLYVIDGSDPEPWQQFETLNFELSQFSKSLADQAKYIVVNKMDLPEARENLPEINVRLKDYEIIPISAKVGTNIVALLSVIRNIYDNGLSDKE